MDSLLIAKVLVPKTNGKNAIGTAYPISKNLIITARHVVDFPERDVSKPISIIWTGTDRSNDESYTVQVPQGNIVFNGGKKYDVVLIRCTLLAYVEIPTLLKDHPVEYQKWKSMGFPLVGKEEDGSRHKVSAMGEIFPRDKNSAILDLESKGDAKEKAGWQGISGAPVFNENNILIAVIISTPNDINERLRAVSIAYLLEKEQEFAELVGEKKSAENKIDLLSQEADLLPYLANRVPQERRLIEKIKAHQAVKFPLICIIHGDQEEGHDTFIMRIKYRLDKILPQEKSVGSQIYSFNCGKFSNREELHENIWFALERYGSREEFMEIVAVQSCPVILHATMYSKDCQHNKIEQSIEFFLNFCKEWRKEHHQLLLICFVFKYIEKESFFSSFFNKNKHIRNYLEHKIDFSKLGIEGFVLPELQKIEREEAETWAITHLGLINGEKLKPKIRKIFKNQKAISMESLALKLEEMLKTVK